MSAGLSSDFSYRKEPMTPLMEPMYMIPGIPIFGFPDFFREDLAGTAIQQRDSHLHGSGNESDQSVQHLCLLLLLAEANPIVDKEFTADDEEQHDADRNIAVGAVDTEVTRDLSGACPE